MIRKNKEQGKAISLRMRGLSYREILKQIPVAKSTLSLWLREVGLSKRQQQRLTLKKLEAGRRGAQRQREKRLKSMREIKGKSKAEIVDISISKTSLWLMGIMLYWAEGAKEREGRPSTGVEFGNSDPFMIKLFIKWLTEICKVAKNRIKYKLYIHENNQHRLIEVKRCWIENLGLEKNDLQAVYFKKHRKVNDRKRIRKNYNGLLIVRVSRSTNLNRTIAGWIEGISQNCCRID
ncbi:MAG: hypothetical protein ABIH69_06990 [bacterium]|nr:hypothetical protein [Candidatus Margulisiibacteriota bacterium]